MRAPMLTLAAVAVAAAGTAAGFLAARSDLFGGPAPAPTATPAPAAAPAARQVLSYRDPSGLPDYSPVPKQDAAGHDYLPVYDDQEADLVPPPPPPAKGRGRILYYRNPMGLPDTSPVAKKDQMGMDYIPVYENEDGNDAGIVAVSPQRMQVLGVRSEAVQERALVRAIRAAGTVAYDERRTFVVTTRMGGWIERLLVNATGETVRRGQPLMQLYSPDLLLAQQEYAALREAAAGADGGSDDVSRRLLDGALRRLQALDAPEDVVQALQRGAAPQRTVTVRSPYAGTVIDKPAVEGMRFMPGDPLYRIVDLATVWLIADVFEQDLAGIALGERAAVTLKAYPGRSFTGRVTFIYPSVGGDTRTARVRIELANPDGLLKENMYATVEIAAPAGRPAPAVPTSAIIDSGARQVVLIDHGDGRFEPREVRLGARADGYAEVIDGVRAGDRVVTAANFLIDAESNLRAALQAFTVPAAAGPAAGHGEGGR